MPHLYPSPGDPTRPVPFYPSSNANAHGTASFFEHEFDTGALMPGQSYAHTFHTAGEFYCNDPLFPQNTGMIIVH